MDKIISKKFYEIFQNDLSLSNDLKNYVDEHIYKFLIIHHNLNIPFEEWLLIKYK